MSKKLKFTFVSLTCLFMLPLISYGQESKEEEYFKSSDKTITLSTSSKTAKEIDEDSPKITFEVKLGKADFLILEPVTANFRISNQTSEVLEIYLPIFPQDAGIKTVSNGQVEMNDRLSQYYINKPGGTRVLKPGEFIEEIMVFEPGNGLFKNSGKIEVQFFLTHRKEKIWSNTINVEVREPNGIDKEAYDFLRLNLGNEYDLFNLKERNNLQAKSFLEVFISRFDTSVYNDYAIISLSSLYSATGQSEKSKDELLKLKNIRNEMLKKIVEEKLSNYRN